MTTRELAHAIGETARSRMLNAIRDARDAGVIRVAAMRPGPTGYVNYEWELAQPTPASLTVYEPEEPQRTGLLDADGNPIVRERNQIGFDVRGDRR